MSPRHTDRIGLWVGAVTAAVALGLKAFYARATPSELGWILEPTVGVVSFVTGASFVFESGDGWLSSDLGLLVAPSCAGVNFLVAAIVTGVVGFAMPPGRVERRVAFALTTLPVAYALTVGANATRIVLGVMLADLAAAGRLPGSADAVHRAEGVAVYFTVLCVAYLLADRVVHPRPPTPA